MEDDERAIREINRLYLMWVLQMVGMGLLLIPVIKIFSLFGLVEPIGWISNHIANAVMLFIFWYIVFSNYKHYKK